MTNTGITRRIDDLGRIVVPAETRRLFNIKEGDALTIHVEDNDIILRKLVASCTFCGSSDEVAEFEGKGICQACVERLKANPAS